MMPVGIAARETGTVCSAVASSFHKGIKKRNARGVSVAACYIGLHTFLLTSNMLGSVIEV
jgi:hypothetical protein